MKPIEQEPKWFQVDTASKLLYGAAIGSALTLLFGSSWWIVGGMFIVCAAMSIWAHVYLRPTASDTTS